MKEYKNFLIIGAVSAFIFYDLARDMLTSKENPFLHLLFEGIILIAILFLLYSFIIRIDKLNNLFIKEKIRNKKLRGELSSYITEQFKTWNLTKSETEVAWLLIKGLPLAEIGTIRQVKEKTIRQQATQIYAKADISNRSELTAWFMEDLLSPKTSTPRD